MGGDRRSPPHRRVRDNGGGKSKAPGGGTSFGVRSHGVSKGSSAKVVRLGSREVKLDAKVLDCRDSNSARKDISVDITVNEIKKDLLDSVLDTRNNLDINQEDDVGQFQICTENNLKKNVSAVRVEVADLKKNARTNLDPDLMNSGCEFQICNENRDLIDHDLEESDGNHYDGKNSKNNDFEIQGSEMVMEDPIGIDKSTHKDVILENCVSMEADGGLQITDLINRSDSGEIQESVTDFLGNPDLGILGSRTNCISNTGDELSSEGDLGGERAESESLPDHCLNLDIQCSNKPGNSQIEDIIIEEDFAQGEGRGLTMYMDDREELDHSAINHTKNLPTGMILNVLNPMFIKDNGSTHLDGDYEMLLNGEGELCKNQNFESHVNMPADKFSSDWSCTEAVREKGCERIQTGNGRSNGIGASGNVFRREIGEDRAGMLYSDRYLKKNSLSKCDQVIDHMENNQPDSNGGVLSMANENSIVKVDDEFGRQENSVQVTGTCCNAAQQLRDSGTDRVEFFDALGNQGLKCNGVNKDPSFNRYGNTLPNVWKKPNHVAVDWHNLGRATDDGKFVNLNMEAVNSNQSKLEKALVGRLIGRKLPFSILQTELKKRWEVYGDFRFLMMGEECFTCIFNSVDARDAVLMGGPWLIGGYIVGLDRWSPSFSQESMSGLTAPVWIRFPKLPLLYWDNDNLARIASMVGQPSWIDAQTSMQGRCAYARVCVRLDLAQKLPTGVWIHGVAGNFFQSVEYEGIHQVCFNCGHIGHKEDRCGINMLNGKDRRGAYPGEATARDKAVFGWKKNGVKSAVISGGSKLSAAILKNGVNNLKEMESTSVPPIAMNKCPLVISDCSLNGAVNDGCDQIGFQSDAVEDPGHGPWILVSRKKGQGRDKFRANRGSGITHQSLKGKSLLPISDVHRDKRKGKGILIQESDSPLASDFMEGADVETGRLMVKNSELPSKGVLQDIKGKQVTLVDQSDRGKMVLEQPGKVGNGFKADRISVKRLDTVFNNLEQVETVTSKGELVPSNALFNSKGKEVLGKSFNFCNEKDEVNKIVVFSASRDENSVFTRDGKANVSGSKERGSSRVPSSKEISRLGPIASGSRKRRKGNVIDDDCSGFHDTCDGAAKESGFLGIVGITDCGGDASPLMS